MIKFIDSIYGTYKIKKVNIKEDFPPADVAIADLEVAIHDAKKMGIEVLKVIHGYGSHGKGGEIKRRTMKYLYRAKRKKEIITFIPGEEWSVQNQDTRRLQERFNELMVDHDLSDLNSGITVIFIQEID